MWARPWGVGVSLNPAGAGRRGAGGRAVRRASPHQRAPVAQCLSASSPTGLGCPDEGRNRGLGPAQATARWVSAPSGPPRPARWPSAWGPLDGSSARPPLGQPRLATQSAQQALHWSSRPGGNGHGQGPRLTPDGACPLGPGARGVPIPRGRRARQGRGGVFSQTRPGFCLKGETGSRSHSPPRPAGAPWSEGPRRPCARPPWRGGQQRPRPRPALWELRPQAPWPPLPGSYSGPVSPFGGGGGRTDQGAKISDRRTIEAREPRSAEDAGCFPRP